MRNTKMTLILEFNPDKLKFIRYNAQEHTLPDLNFAQSNGDDPLDVQNYYYHIRTGKILQNELIYALRYEKQWIGFFSVGLTKVKQKNNLDILRQVENVDATGVTEGLLIDKIGIDQKYRCFGIGRYILQFCIGLTKAIRTNSQIRIIIFETTDSLAAKIYHPKYGFNYLNKDKKTVWAYKAIN